MLKFTSKARTSSYYIIAIIAIGFFLMSSMDSPFNTLNDSKGEKKKVWIDTDLSVGMERENRPGVCDVDDGYAVLQLMKSDQIEIKAISAVFGNTTIDNAYALSQKMVRDFYEDRIPVFKGASGAIQLDDVQNNEAIEAMADALRKEKLTILAIGPATNVGLLLLNYPELKDSIEEVVLVAGRRTHTDYFAIGNKGYHARDANFDKDPTAFRLMFQYKVPVTLCPFEISNKVWLNEEDLSRLSNGNGGNKWLAKESRPWLNQWNDLGEDGFNPFDVLASHYLIHPEDIISEPLNARLEIHHDDTKSDTLKAYKPYLLCDKEEGYPIRYCYDVVDGYHEHLMASFE